MREFVKLPSFWITNQENPGLVRLKWGVGGNAKGIAALMIYLVIAHHVNDKKNKKFSEVGLAKLSYSDFERITGLSRATISEGLKKLKDLEIVDIDKKGKTNIYKIEGYNSNERWAKLPCSYLYEGNRRGSIRVFHDFHLRRKTELNALKMYLIAVAFRDNSTNYAMISYEKINYYSGIPLNDIRSAISMLINLRLLHVDRVPAVPVEGQNNDDREFNKNMYRLVGLRGRHLGNVSADNLVYF